MNRFDHITTKAKRAGDNIGGGIARTGDITGRGGDIIVPVGAFTG